MSFLKKLRFVPILMVFILAGCATPPATVRDCCRAKTAVNGPAMATDLAATNAAVESDAVWQTDAGTDFRLAELRGHPVLIAMFYASCDGICVITKNDMKAVEASLPAAVRERTVFVLVTLAPDLDTPAVLKQYRAEQGLAENRWLLLRGPARQTAQLAAQLGVAYGRDGSGLFRHSSVIAVLDAAGKFVLQQDGVQADLAKTVGALAAGK